MASTVISVRLEEPLLSQLEAFAASNDLSVSAALREVVARHLTDTDPVGRGWQEGRREAMAQVYAAIGDALADLKLPP